MKAPGSLFRPTTQTRTILVAGSLASTLDILAAFTQAYLGRGTSPVAVLQYIASAVWGPEAFNGGLLTAAAGLLYYVTIAFSWTTLLVFVYPRIPILSRGRLTTGIGFGVLIWFMMNRIVVPLTNAKSGPFVLKNAVIAALILIVMVGLPATMVTDRFYSAQGKSPEADKS